MHSVLLVQVHYTQHVHVPYMQIYVCIFISLNFRIRNKDHNIQDVQVPQVL